MVNRCATLHNIKYFEFPAQIVFISRILRVHNAGDCYYKTL